MWRAHQCAETPLRDEFNMLIPRQVLVMTTPKFLTCELGYRHSPINEITGSVSRRESCLRSPHTISSVFDALTFIPCWRNQVANVSRTVSRHLDIAGRRFRGPVTAIWVSSAYLTDVILNPSISVGMWQDMSFDAILYRRGPKHVPWKVPIVIGRGSDKYSPIFTRCICPSR